MEFGALSLVPPILAIVLAIITKEVLLSLFLGIFSGCLIYSYGNPLGALITFIELITGTYSGTYSEDGVEEYVASGVMSDPWNVEVILIIFLLGGLIGLMVRSGGSAGFAELLSKRIKSRKGAEATTWGIGLLIFFDDYFNALTTGSIMRPVTDRYKISREKLSYIIDSTSVGICLIIPFSSWVAFLCSLIGESYRAAGVEGGNPFLVFVQSIPYNYYAWLSIIMVIMVIIFRIDFGPMAKAEKRTRETGKLCDATFSGGGQDEDDYSSIEVSERGRANDLLVPIVILIILAFVMMMFTGGYFETFDFYDALNNMDGALALVYAFAIVTIFSIIYFAVRRVSKVIESIGAFVTGAKSVVYVTILLVFAWSIGAIGERLDMDGFVTAQFAENVPAFIVPVLIFIISCVMTFATGATWGTYAIMLPIALPIAFALDITPLACITAVIGGGGFGNHCSPLADTAILSSASSNIRHTDHIKTQIPYSVTCAACACVGFVLSGFMDNWVIPLAATFAVFIVAVIVLSRMFGENRYNVGAPEKPEDAKSFFNK
ncbi:MAG: Na+/H+ antiporter NhaC family protein [Clostridiales Family XIII bacterium]|jgi:Na+/H+ antiporter NhaC|nr:Na+/H+ antiporter NhaC family protein [Clostridiales Family XIII bacterium]